MRYTSVQKNLQRLVERRGHQGSRVFRGVQVAHHYNSFGWPDKERAFSKQGTRILFIGDSFLQVRSTQNVAQRVETNLRLHDEDVEIINLSEDATSPRDYRYRLFEFAFDYEPDHIMVFLYGANDLSRTYKHRPYAPKPFYITPTAVRILRSTGRYPEDVLQTLDELERQHQQFPRKEDLLAALDEYGLSIGDRAFVYFVTFAYSAAPSEGFPLERVAPHTLTRLTKLWETVFPNTATARRQSGWRNRYEAFQRLTTFPREKQLRLIAEQAAQKNKQSDPQLFLDKLQEIDSVWLDELLAGPDMTIFLWPAIKKFVLDQPEFKDPQPEAVEALIEQHLKLFGEFVEQSERHGIGISFVLIPEASQVDEGFYRFWLPVFDFRQWKAVAHANTSALAQQLPSLAPTLYLMEHKEQLSDSYWRFDGHWNERGNAVVADIVTDYLLRNLEKIER